MEIIDTYKGKFKIVDDGYCTLAVNVDDESFFYAFDRGTNSEDITDYINHEYEFDKENESHDCEEDDEG